MGEYANGPSNEGEELGFLDFETGRATSSSLTTGRRGAFVNLGGKGGE